MFTKLGERIGDGQMAYPIRNRLWFTDMLEDWYVVVHAKGLVCSWFPVENAFSKRGPAGRSGLALKAWRNCFWNGMQISSEIWISLNLTCARERDTQSACVHTHTQRRGTWELWPGAFFLSEICYRSFGWIVRVVLLWLTWLLHTTALFHRLPSNIRSWRQNGHARAPPVDCLHVPSRTPDG